MDEGRLLQSLRQHKDIVTCIAVGPFILNQCKAALRRLTLRSCSPWPVFVCLVCHIARLRPARGCQVAKLATRSAACAIFPNKVIYQNACPSCSLYCLVCSHPLLKASECHCPVFGLFWA